MEFIYKFLSCFEKPDSEDTGIPDLKIPLLISKVSEDETTIVAKDKPTLLQIARKVLSKKTDVSNIIIDGDYIKVGNTKIYIETLRIDDHVRYTCNIVYAHIH